MPQKKFQNLTIKNAFMFAAVMEDSLLCTSFLSRILDMNIAEVKIKTEESLSSHPEYHGVRLERFFIPLHS